MYWWQRATELTIDKEIGRFGFITTNSITQSFNRKVVQVAMANGLSLSFAIPDHPWVDGADGASVRVAMTVGATASVSGSLFRLSSEETADDGTALVTFTRAYGTIHSDLKVGADVTSAKNLKANSNISFSKPSPNPLCKRKGAMQLFPLVAF
jgi:hypothetical protein